MKVVIVVNLKAETVFILITLKRNKENHLDPIVEEEVMDYIRVLTEHEVIVTSSDAKVHGMVCDLVI